MMIINIDGGVHFRAIQFGDSCPAAPGQKCRIIFYTIYQIEHLFRAVRDQHRFIY